MRRAQASAARAGSSICALGNTATACVRLRRATNPPCPRTRLSNVLALTEPSVTSTTAGCLRSAKSGSVREPSSDIGATGTAPWSCSVASRASASCARRSCTDAGRSPGTLARHASMSSTSGVGTTARFCGRGGRR
jgi:hypothetical protein